MPRRFDPGNAGRPPKKKRTLCCSNRTAGSYREKLKRSATQRAQKLSQEQEWEGTSIYDTAKLDQRLRTGKSVARKRCRRALGTTQETASQVHRSGRKRKRKRTATRGRGSGRTTQDTPTKDKDTPTPKDNLDYFTTRLGLELCNDANATEKRKVVARVNRCVKFFETENIRFNGKIISINSLTPLPPFENTRKVKADYGIRRFELDTCTMQSKCCELCHSYTITHGIITRSNRGNDRKIIMKKPYCREYTYDNRKEGWTQIFACPRCVEYIKKSMQRQRKDCCKGKEIPFYNVYDSRKRTGKVYKN